MEGESVRFRLKSLSQERGVLGLEGFKGGVEGGSGYVRGEAISESCRLGQDNKKEINGKPRLTKKLIGK